MLALRDLSHIGTSCISYAPGFTLQPISSCFCREDIIIMFSLYFVSESRLLSQPQTCDLHTIDIDDCCWINQSGQAKAGMGRNSLGASGHLDAVSRRVSGTMRRQTVVDS